MKNVLFLVTGMTPQIITETVWALACDPNLADDERFVPDEIWVLSTDDGLNQIKATLFEEGVFEQFKKDYPIIAKVAFDKNHLCVIQKDGTPLKDLKTPGDNELSANLICQQVRNFTQDDNVRLHVSIAGGRKTMGFYAGYALSLYGRAQDSMSHVLVDSEFESAMGFYYPTQTDYYVTQRHTGKRLNAKDAQIWLANIPFVRMSEAISDKHQLKQGARFGEVVEVINRSFEPITLTLFVKKRLVQINEQEPKKINPINFAFLHWFCDYHLQGKGIKAPTNNKTDYATDEIAKNKFAEISKEFNHYYEYQKAVAEQLVDKKFFIETKSKLYTKLVEVLGGLELANRIMPIKNEQTDEFCLPKSLKVTINYEKETKKEKR
ncbi:CRISPR-associated ring nuclease Csm6 [Moraxella bovoculi]|uniref:CRISPR-associated ring nuclease Csm6 n=1 Tax=Moraxella bovoculi TaxID=386891 RepID=UPI003F503178